MIKGVVKGRSLTIIGTDGDVFTSGSVGLKIKVAFDDEWDGLVKQAVFQNGSNAYISTAINDEFEVPLEVLSIPGRVLRIGIRGTNGTTLVIPTIYAECRIYEGSDKNGAAGQEWSPSEVDQVLSAVAAIDNKVGDLDDLLTTAKDSVVSAINEVFAQPIPTGVSDDLKEALLQLAQKVAYIDEDGQNYYDDLYYALYPGNLISITATYDTAHKALVGDTLDSLKPYLTVIAFYDDNTSREVTNYTLSGSLSNAGSNTISVYFVDHLTSVTASFVVSTISVSSISAVFTQGQAVIYSTDSLDVLKQYLVVTAAYSDSSTGVVSAEDYTLSGTLTEGTSTITVIYGGESDTFSVTVSGSEYTSYSYELGGINTSGEETDATNRLRTDYIPITSGNAMAFMVNPSLQWFARRYDSNKDFVGSYPSSGWSSDRVYTPASSGYVRFVFRKSTDATLNGNELDGYVVGLAQDWFVFGSKTIATLAVYNGKGISGTDVMVNNANRALSAEFATTTFTNYTAWYPAEAITGCLVQKAMDANGECISGYTPTITMRIGTTTAGFGPRANTVWNAGSSPTGGVGIRYLFANSSSTSSPLPRTPDGYIVKGNTVFRLVEGTA